MQHIQHLPLSWLRKPTPRVAEPKAPPLELPDRERIQRLARLYHRQLASAKQDTRVYYELLRQQTEALRQFTLELTPEQADAFMNMYTEESSAVEREWQAKKGKWRSRDPLPPATPSELHRHNVVTCAARARQSSRALSASAATSPVRSCARRCDRSATTRRR